MEFFDNPQIEIMFQLLLAALCGGLIGVEREYRKKEAGFRTYTLVCLGAALFTTISMEAGKKFLSYPGISFDPARIFGQVVVGIGFLGTGLIVFKGFHVEGLTTAAGLWITAAVGSAIGAGFYFPASFATFLTIGILAGLKMIEQKYFDKEGNGKL